MQWHINSDFTWHYNIWQEPASMKGCALTSNPIRTATVTAVVRLKYDNMFLFSIFWFISPVFKVLVRSARTTRKETRRKLKEWRLAANAPGIKVDCKQKSSVCIHKSYMAGHLLSTFTSICHQMILIDIFKSSSNKLYFYDTS